MKKYPFLKKVGSKQKRIIFKCQFGPLWVMKNDHFLKRSIWAPLEWRERDHFLKKSKFSISSFAIRFYRKIFVVDFFENVSWPHDPSDDDIVDVCCNL